MKTREGQPIVVWGHNPGQWSVKDTITSPQGSRKDTRPYPAAIAPLEHMDDTGLARRRTVLTATVVQRDVTRLYIGGTDAERHPLAIRQMSDGRLESDSPLYECFAQMSLTHTGLAARSNGILPHVLIVTALPVGWRTADAEEAFKAHIRIALKGRATIRDIIVQSEPNAVVAHEMIDDTGAIIPTQAKYFKDVVCVGDIGGNTLNRTVLVELRAVAGQGQSPLLGSRHAIQLLANQAGMPLVDAEQRLRAALTTPGADPAADAILTQYREAVVAELQQAWSIYKHAPKLFAGGTVHWVGEALLRAFGPHARIVKEPQQAIAAGLWRYGMMKYQQQARAPQAYR